MVQMQSGDPHQNLPIGHSGATKDNNAIDLLINSKSVGVPGMGPGEIYMGLNSGPYSRNGQKTKSDMGGLL